MEAKSLLELGKTTKRATWMMFCSFVLIPGLCIQLAGEHIEERLSRAGFAVKWCGLSGL